MACYTDEDGEFENPCLYTDHARARDSGLLTYDDREYLLREKDIDGPAEAQLRQRLRDRVRNGLLDFELLLKLLSQDDIATIGNDLTPPPWPDEEGNPYNGAEFTLAFLYHLVSEHSTASFERLLESAIELAGQRSKESVAGSYYRAADATVNIDVDWEVYDADPEAALDQLRAGEPLDDHQIGALVRQGDMTDEDWQQLRELYDRE